MELQCYGMLCIKLHSFKEIDRTVIIKPPKEDQTNELGKLNKCVYSLTDTPRCCYLGLKEELLKLNATVSMTQVYSATSKMRNSRIDVVFHRQHTMGGTDEFKADLIDRLGQILITSSKFFQAFSYLGIEIHQSNNKSITIN